MVAGRIFAIGQVKGKATISIFLLLDMAGNGRCFHSSLDTHRFIAPGMWASLNGEVAISPWTQNRRFKRLEVADRVMLIRSLDDRLLIVTTRTMIVDEVMLLCLGTQIAVWYLLQDISNPILTFTGFPG